AIVVEVFVPDLDFRRCTKGLSGNKSYKDAQEF
ncbi:MAG: hypothetical protein ACI9MB_000970, partial [Verrucomicrobiales bacterium]